METNDLAPFILRMPFFKNHSIEELGIAVALEVLFFEGSIDCYCPKCKNDSVFLRRETTNDKQIKVNVQLGSIASHGTKKQLIPQGIYPLEFNCSRDKDHKLYFIFKVDNQKLAKIGQSPSALEILEGDFKKYKDQLGVSFGDLNSSMILYTNNFGIASFTYLRRLVENYFMCDAIDSLIKVDEKVSKSYYESLKFKDKLALVKDYLPNSFNDNKVIYSILSSGIHGLTEKECLEYFTPLKDCILICLEEKQSELRRKKLSESVKNTLQKIGTTINTRQ